MLSLVIINASHVFLSGNKLNKKNGKLYYRHTGFPGGIKKTTARDLLLGQYAERDATMDQVQNMCLKR